LAALDFQRENGVKEDLSGVNYTHGTGSEDTWILMPGLALSWCGTFTSHRLLCLPCHPSCEM